MWIELITNLRPTSTRLGRAWDGMLGYMSIAAGLLIVLSIVVTTLDVASRAVTGKSVPGALESGELLMVGIVYLAVANTQRRNQHVAVSVVSDRLPPRVSKALFRGIMVVVAAVLAIAAWQTGVRSVESFNLGEYRYGLVNFPLWPARMLVTFGLAVLAIEVLRASSRGPEFGGAGVTAG